MKRKLYRRTAKCDHNRTATVRGLNQRSGGACITLRDLNGVAIARNNRDWAVVWLTRTELRKLRDCMDRILCDKPRKKARR